MTAIAILAHGPSHNFGGASIFVVIVLVVIVAIFVRMYGPRRKLPVSLHDNRTKGAVDRYASLLRTGRCSVGLRAMTFELTEQIEKHLVNDQIVWLTTVTSAGRPAPRPVWFVWDGEAVVIYSLPDGVKFRHIAANDQVSLHFNCTPGGGDVVVLSGRAELPEEAPLPSEFPGLLEKYLESIHAMGYTQEWYDTYSRAIHVIPERAWTIPD